VNIKRFLGIDGFDFMIQFGVTCMLMVVASSVATGGHDEAPIALIVASSLGVLAWRRNRARGEIGPDTGEMHLDRLQDLESRVTELEIERGRVLELEERLDFTERLLTQQREAVRQLGAPREEV
jgi:hypothetical protein